MTTLLNATNEWANRPADQRFPSLDAMHTAVQHHRDVAVEAPRTDVRALRVRPLGNADGDIRPTLIGPTGAQAGFTHYSFGQLARKVGAPADYLRTLPAQLASDNLQHGIDQFKDTDTTKLLFAKNGDLTLRALTGDGYTRIWNADITKRLMRLKTEQPEWQEAPAAFDGSRGMYASDSDMFAFMVDNERPIFESLPGGGLGRGFFVWNSEVGAASFGVMTFFYEYVCGNHRVWGASGVQELRIRHVGTADGQAFRQLGVELRKYANASAHDDEQKITSAMKFMLGEKKEDVLDKVFGLRVPALSRRMIEASYDLAVENEDRYGDPRSAWGLTGGMTQIARDLPNSDERMKLDRAAGRIMQMAF